VQSAGESRRKGRRWERMSKGIGERREAVKAVEQA
jgi:hypothetical protein